MGYAVDAVHDRDAGAEAEDADGRDEAEHGTRSRCGGQTPWGSLLRWGVEVMKTMGAVTVPEQTFVRSACVVYAGSETHGGGCEGPLMQARSQVWTGTAGVDRERSRGMMGFHVVDGCS